MSKETENISGERAAYPFDLQHKPQRRSGNKKVLLLLVVLGALIIGGGLLLVWYGGQGGATTTSNTSGKSPSFAKTGGTSYHPASSPPPQMAELAIYVKQHIAQTLHLSESQLATTLQDGMKAGDVEILQKSALQQGIAPDQLHTLEINILTTGLQQVVSEGKIQQQNADAQLTSYKNMDPPSLNIAITKMCLA